MPAVQPQPIDTPVRWAWPRALTVPLALALIIVCFYWKLTFTKQYDWVWGPDLTEQVLPWFEEEGRQVQQGHAPLWDPHQWAGQPMIGQAQPGAAYFLNYLLWLMPRKHGHIMPGALQWYFVIIHYMSALFCYLLCRDLGRSRFASLIAGLVFALAAYVGNISWPQMLNGAVWAPLIFLFALRAVRGYRPLASAALCGLFWGISWLSGHHQVPVFVTLALGGTLLYYFLRSGRPDWRIARMALIAFAITLLVGSLQIIPAEEYGHLAKRWVGAAEPLTWNQKVPYTVQDKYSLFPISLLAVVYPGMYNNADPYIGVAALAFALLAIALAWRNPMVKLFAAIMIGGLLYALGKNDVIQGFLYSVVPLVEKARTPSFATIIWGLGASVLVAFGLDAFDAPETAPSPWPRRAAVIAAGFGVATWLVILTGMATNKMAWQTDDRIAMSAFLALLIAALLHAWRTRNLTRRSALVLAALLVVIELGNTGQYLFAPRNEAARSHWLTEVRSNPDIANWLNARPKPFRVEAQGAEFGENWAPFNDLDAIKAFGASVTTNVLDTEFYAWPTRMLYGVRYTVAKAPVSPEQREVFAGASGMKVYENPRTFPRAWAVHELVHLKNVDEERWFVNNHFEDLHTKAITLDAHAPALTACTATDTVSVASYAAERVALRANLGCSGMVVLSDTFYPGWKAAVDGRAVNIQQVNIAMRGVLVPAGAHEVVFSYRPASVYAGAALTFSGILATFALVWYDRRRLRS